MAKHTVASVASEVSTLKRDCGARLADIAVLIKETKLQDKRISAVEASTTTLLVAMKGVETTVKNMAKTAPKSPKEEKKPRRLEIIGGVIVALVGLQSLGVFDGIRAGLAAWLSGSG